MANYLVGYDLNQPGQNYTRLFSALKAYGYYYHALDSTWFIKTTQSTEEVLNNLRQYVDTNDTVLVVKLGDQAAWNAHLDKDWLRGFYASS